MNRVLDLLGVGRRVRRWKAAGAEAALGVHDRAQLAGVAWREARSPLAQSVALGVALALVSVVAALALSAAVIVHAWDGPMRVRAAWAVALTWGVVWAVLCIVLLARMRQTRLAVAPLQEALQRDLHGDGDTTVPPPDAQQLALQREEILARIAEQRERRALVRAHREAAREAAAARPPVQPLSAKAVQLARAHPVAAGAAAAAVVAVIGPRRVLRWTGWLLPILLKLR